MENIHAKRHGPEAIWYFQFWYLKLICLFLSYFSSISGLKIQQLNKKAILYGDP